jgi:hypothetical protein
MANIIGSFTLNQNKIVELDGDPLLSATPGLDIGDICIAYSFPGIWAKSGPGDTEFVRLDNPSTLTLYTAGNNTVALVNSSTFVHRFVGTVAGQILDMPDATTLIAGRPFFVVNDSTVNVKVRSASGSLIANVGAGQRFSLLLIGNSNAQGVWSTTVSGGNSDEDRAFTLLHMGG